MIELVDKFDMISIIPERQNRFLEKETKVKKDGRHKKIVLPVDTTNNIPMDDVRKIEDCCGIYVLITRSGRTYIGSSMNIKRRIRNHRNNIEYLSDIIDTVVIYVTKDVESARKLEKTLIMETRPDININMKKNIAP